MRCVSGKHGLQQCQSNQWFFGNLTNDYKPLLTADELAQIKSKGYYSTYVKERNLRVISLYSAPMDALNFYLLVRTYDVDGQFSWLWNTLKASESNTMLTPTLIL